MTSLDVYLQTYFNIEQKQATNISHLFHPQKLSKGDFFIKEGQYNPSLSFIEAGYFRIFNYHNGKEITQWIASPQELITDLSSLLFNQAAKWNIQALTDTTLLTINADNYRQIHHHITQWDALEKLFISKCFLTLEDRVYSFLSLSAEERYLAFFENKPELLNQVPLIYIASMLGMSPETLSRIRKKRLG